VSPVSDYTGDFWNRSTAFGDVLGRQKLYEMGITLDAQVTHVLQGDVSGGPEGGPSSVLGGLLDFGVTFDTARLGLWSGGLLVANAQTNWGNTLLRISGSLSPTNCLAAYPIAGENDTVLMEYYYVQPLPKDLSLIAGKPAFTLLHVGSGFANGIANLHNAGRANTRMVNFVGALFPVTTFAYKGKPVIKVPADGQVTTLATVDHDILSALGDFAKAVGAPPQPAARRRGPGDQRGVIGLFGRFG
jgi:hypothetical protein